jgi:hypothetical protein
MVQVVEEMSSRLGQIADAEQALVRALGEALSRVDQQLLQDVRNLTIEHETRRGAILHELQGLAARIGAFPAAREPVAGLEYMEPGPAQIAPSAPMEAPMSHHMAPAPSHIPAANVNLRHFTRGGDWRQATNNIEGELDLFFKDRAAAG